MLNKLSDEEQHKAYLEEFKDKTLSELHSIANKIGFEAVDNYPLTYKNVLGKNRKLKAIKELIKNKKDERDTK